MSARIEVLALGAALTLACGSPHARTEATSRPVPARFKVVDLTDRFGATELFPTPLTRGGDFCAYTGWSGDAPPFCTNAWTLVPAPREELRGYATIAVNGRGGILAEKLGIPGGPYVLDVGGALEILPGLLDGQRVEYAALDDAGRCAGDAMVIPPGAVSFADVTNVAVVYRDGALERLPGILAEAIDEHGGTAGVAALADGTDAAAIWANGRTTTVPTLGGRFMVAETVNARGQVAGFGYTASGSAVPQHAFFWDGAALHDLGALPALAKSESWAAGINDRGDVVGRGAVGAFLYSGGELIALNDRVDMDAFFVQGASSVNDDLVILGWGYRKSEVSLPDGPPMRALLLLPER